MSYRGIDGSGNIAYCNFTVTIIRKCNVRYAEQKVRTLIRFMRRVRTLIRFMRCVVRKMFDDTLCIKISKYVKRHNVLVYL